MVAMRDGVKLATDIYRRAPTARRWREVPRYWRHALREGARSGCRRQYYVLADTAVRQDVRGATVGRRGVPCRRSERWQDTAAWIGAHPVGWRNRHHGSSYGGATQHALPSAMPLCEGDGAAHTPCRISQYGVRHNARSNCAVQLGATMAMPSKPRPHGGAARAHRTLRRRPRCSTWEATSATSNQPAVASRDDSAEVRARLRSLADRGHEPRRLRQLLKDSGSSVVDHLPSIRTARIPYHRLVRFLGRLGGQPQFAELRKAKKSLQRLYVARGFTARRI